MQPSRAGHITIKRKLRLQGIKDIIRKMPLKPITDPNLLRAEYKKREENAEKKGTIRAVVKEVYETVVTIIQTTDKKSYNYIFPFYCSYGGWQWGPEKGSLLKLSDPISEIIDALKKLFPTMRVELKVYTCSGGSGLNCKCGGHQNCISIDWSEN